MKKEINIQDTSIFIEQNIGDKRMSTAQQIASQRFLEAMGPMVNEEQKMMQVILYINSLHQTPTISQEHFDSLHTIDELDAHLEARIREQYQSAEV